VKKIEVFFDYNCPYCLKGHNQLVKFLRDSPETEIIWHPCEIYERPQNYPGMYHTDLYIQAMFFAERSGIDLWQFHEKMYDIIFSDGVNVEDITALINAFTDILDSDALRKAIEAGEFRNKLRKANHYAFKITGVEIVPTYRANGRKLQDRQEFFGAEN
jgi:predicted DsbA family dithiol-disulfide isomerase